MEFSYEMLWKFWDKNRYEMLYYNMSNIYLLFNLYGAFLNFLTLVLVFSNKHGLSITHQVELSFPLFFYLGKE